MRARWIECAQQLSFMDKAVIVEVLLARQAARALYKSGESQCRNFSIRAFLRGLRAATTTGLPVRLCRKSRRIASDDHIAQLIALHARVPAHVRFALEPNARNAHQSVQKNA